MYRFNAITNLAPLFSVLPPGAWLMLVASAIVGGLVKPAAPGKQSFRPR